MIDNEKIIRIKKWNKKKKKKISENEKRFKKISPYKRQKISFRNYFEQNIDE